jgi:chorismate dehydratase
MPVRVGAVSYLNARPLAHHLERWPDRFIVRYDPPSRCADLLHQGEIGLGLIPSIEYVYGDYHVVPGVGVVSDGPVASVALFTRVPVERISTIALDTSSRTSSALIRVLCSRHFGIQPAFVPHPPDIAAMLDRADAAMVIGDRALFADASALGAQKMDLGAAWQSMTGLPFVYAFWAGPADALTAEDVARVQDARTVGEDDIDGIVSSFFPGDALKQRVGFRYLRENIQFGLGAREQQGFELFARLAAEVAAAPPPVTLRFFMSRRRAAPRAMSGD